MFMRLTMTAGGTPLDDKTLAQLTKDVGRVRADDLLRCFAVETHRRMARIEVAAAVPDMDARASSRAATLTPSP